jgi:hypothetical protein
MNYKFVNCNGSTGYELKIDKNKISICGQDGIFYDGKLEKKFDMNNLVGELAVSIHDIRKDSGYKLEPIRKVYKFYGFNDSGLTMIIRSNDVAELFHHGESSYVNGYELGKIYRTEKCKFVSYDKKVSYDLTFQDKDNILIYDKDKVYHGKTDNWINIDYYVNYILDKVMIERKKSGYELGNILKTYYFSDGIELGVRSNNVIEIYFLGSGIPVVGYAIGKLYKN